MKYISILVGLTVIVGLVIFLPKKAATPANTQYKITTLTVGREIFTAQIADIKDLQELGLSFRPDLGQKQAMLFVFPQSDIYRFWMKDMNFPIDIIWLDANKKVMYTEKNLLPSTYPQTFGPNIPSQYVVEVASGTIDRVGIFLGQKITFSL
jgi:uncharacterized membrane protein (UPF0127 family)